MYGIADFQSYEKIIATPANLQLYIPIIRSLGTISDAIISRSLTIDPSELDRRFPITDKVASFALPDNGNNMYTDEDGTDEEEKDTDKHANAQACWNMEIGHHNGYQNTGTGRGAGTPQRGIVEGMIVDHFDADDMDYDNAEQTPMDIDMDIPPDVIANGLVQPAWSTSTRRAQSIVSDASALSRDSRLSNVSAALHLLPIKLTKPVIHKTFRLLYVPDPSRHVREVSETRIDLSFTTRTISKQQFRIASSEFPQLIFHPSQGRLKGRDVERARLSEWVRYPANEKIK